MDKIIPSAQTKGGHQDIPAHDPSGKTASEIRDQMFKSEPQCNKGRHFLIMTSRTNQFGSRVEKCCGLWELGWTTAITQ